MGFVVNEERSFFWRLTGRQNLLFFGVLDNLFGTRLVNRVDGVEPALRRIIGNILQYPWLALAEEFAGTNLLMYLDPAEESDLVIVEGFHDGAAHLSAVNPSSEVFQSFAVFRSSRGSW